MLLSAARPIASLTTAEALDALQSQVSGLDNAEALRRRSRFGANQLPAVKRRSLLLRFGDQLRHFMALMLWAAGTMAFFSGTPELGWAIWSVILINALFSFWQEFQAERTLAALIQVLPRQVRVWRQGVVEVVAAEALVPGDVVELEEGDHVPADCRVLQASSLYLDVAVLTGESLPVARSSEPVAKRLKTPEASNLLPAGTTVAAGRATALVYATGAETEFGQVAHLTATTLRSPSTLELQVARIVRTITTVALSMGTFTFLASWLFVGIGSQESLVFAIGIIVAFVPEGLLPTVTRPWPWRCSAWPATTPWCVASRRWKPWAPSVWFAPIKPAPSPPTAWPCRPPGPPDPPRQRPRLLRTRSCCCWGLPSAPTPGSITTVRRASPGAPSAIPPKRPCCWRP